MTIAVTIVNTANRPLKFVQSDEGAIRNILSTISMPGQLFSNRSLIIGSETETHILLPSSITRIEIDTQLDLGVHLPQIGDTPLTQIENPESIPPSELTDTHIFTQIDFFFEGGDRVAVWFSNPRPTSSVDRLTRFNRIFDQPVLIYKLPRGGVGFMNPARMTSALFATAADKLPVGAWMLNPSN